MKKIFIVLFLLSIWLLSGELEILEQNAERILLRISVDQYNLTEFNEFTELSFPDWSFNQIVGAPNLPEKMINIGVPHDGDIEFTIVSTKITTENLLKPISPVPSIVESGKTHEYIYNIDSRKYIESNQSFIHKNEPYGFRRFKAAPVIFSPVIYHSESNKVEICEEIVLEIRISGSTEIRNYEPDKVENIYKDFLLNYDQARFWRENSTPVISKMPFEKSDFWYRVETEESGLYQIGTDELDPLPEFYDLEDLRLFTMYREVIGENILDYKFELTEIPLFVNDGSVYFNKERLDDNRLNLNENNIFWLTFGYDDISSPRKITNTPQINNANPVIDFERKINANSRNSRSDLDGVIIYPAVGVFDVQSQQLADLHFELNFELKSQADIFDEYAGGTEDPVAIKNYLEETYSNNPNLFYCVLMGSGTRNWGNEEKNKIITYALSSNSNTVDDNFCIFTGSDRPALAMGRIPTKNESDMDFYIDRITTYIQDPTPGFWRNKVLILPDDENKSGGYEGFGYYHGFNHSARAQDAGDALNEEIYVEKVMAFEYGFDVFQNKPDARNAMIDVINDGCLVWYYIGHGNNDVLGDEDYFRGSQHMNLLQNIDHLPLFIAASCSVGEFDKLSFDCIAEKLVFHEDGGAIASIAAISSCSGNSNTALIKYFLESLLNESPVNTIGYSLLDAKINLDSIYGNSKQYHILGDPMLYVNTPRKIGSIVSPPDSIQARETVTINGNFGTGNSFNSTGDIRIFEPDYELLYSNTNFFESAGDTIYFTLNYTREGNSLFTGSVDVVDGNYSSTFIVPDDVHSGENGQTVNYLFDEINKQDFLSAYYPITFSDIPLDITSTGPPEVTLYLESNSFLPGDHVSTNPVLIADIEDENGINIVGSAGHKILALLDDSTELIDVTTGFIYDSGSYTKGELTWQLDEISEGYHSITLVVSDNLNNPTVAETNFIAAKSGKVSITKMLPYPNPMEIDGHFTFVITEDADITITIYTITGRKIRTIFKSACLAGYNQIYWDGKDGDGDEIANNTYFYKIKAKQQTSKKVAEEIGKVVILK